MKFLQIMGIWLLTVTWVFLLLAGCGTEEKVDADSSLDLSGISLSREMSGPVKAALKRAKNPDSRSSQVSQIMAQYNFLSHAINGLNSTDAVDSLFTLWTADPENLVWLDLALRSNRILKDDARYQELLAAEALNDTTTAVGCFRMGYKNYRRKSGGRWLQKSQSLQGELGLLQQIWLSKWLAIVDQGDLRPDDGVRRLLAQLEKAWSVGGLRLEFELWTSITNGLLAGDHLDDALHTAALAGTLARTVNDPYLQTRAEFWLGLVMMGREDLNAAGEQFQKAADLSSQNGFNWMHKVSNNRVAKVLDRQGDYAAVLRMNRVNLALARATGDSINIPIILMNIAHAHRALGALDSCRISQDEAIDCVDKFPHPTNVARLPMMLAEYHAQVGQYATLDSLFKVALDNPTNRLVAEEIVKLHMGLIQGGLEQGRAGLVHRSIVQIDSLRNISQSRGEQIKVDYQDDLMIAEFYTQQGEFARAMDYLDRAASTLADSDSPEARWRLLRAQGLLARERGDLDTALAVFSEGLIVIKELDNPDLQARGRYLLGAALLDAGRYDVARALFPDEDESQSFGGRFRTRLSSRLFRGMTFARAGESHEAVLEFRKALDMCSPRSPADLVVRVHLELGQALKALREIPEASFHLHQAWETLVDFEEGGDDALGEAFHGSLRRETAEALMALYLAWPQTAPIQDVARATLELRANLMQKSMHHKKSFSDLDWEPGQLVFFTGKNASYRWMISPYGIEVTVLPSTGELEKLVSPVLSDMSSPGRSVAPDPASRLAEVLLSGAEPAWPKGMLLRLVCDEVLGSVPWVALPLPASFGEGHLQPALQWGPLVYQRHLSSVGGQRTSCAFPSSDGALLTVGANSGGHSDLPNLFHAEEEAKALGALWTEDRTTVLLGEDASWNALQEVDLASFCAIHLASHARIYKGLPEQSYLVLSGALGQEQLTAHSVSELTLHADLVYLSSCEAASAVGGSVVGGFVQAFIDAGAGAVIASSLGVDDQASRFLAQQVYKHWLSGVSLPEALRLGQVDLFEADPRWEHPFYWGFYRIYQ